MYKHQSGCPCAKRIILKLYRKPINKLPVFIVSTCQLCSSICRHRAGKCKLLHMKKITLISLQPSSTNAISLITTCSTTPTHSLLSVGISLQHNLCRLNNEMTSFAGNSMKKPRLRKRCRCNERIPQYESYACVTVSPTRNALTYILESLAGYSRTTYEQRWPEKFIPRAKSEN